MLKAYVFRLYPNKKQEQMLIETFGCARFVWNYHVDGFINYKQYEEEGREIKKTYKQIKDIAGNEFLNKVSAAALQSVDINYKEYVTQFCNKNRKTKVGFPKFKKKFKDNSYSLTNSIMEGKKSILRFEIKDNKIRIEKIGKVKIELSQEIPSHYVQKKLTIKRNQAGQYFVSILVDTKENCKPLPKTGKTIGIDLGIKTFITTSDNKKIENHKFLAKSQGKISRYQQVLSNKTKGSKRYRKHCKKLAKLHLKVTNQRNDLIHKVTKQLVTDYDVICVETLNVKKMMQDPSFAKHLADVSFGYFIEVLTYKCTWYEKILLKVDTYYPSSKTCSKCGHVKEKLNINERTYNCEICGHTIDRDLNAAKNIERKALGDQVLYEQSKTV